MLEFPTIGLTGGIACGKSTVIRLLERQGCKVLDADQIAREVVAPGTPGLAEVLRVFGPEVQDPQTGGLNRNAMADIAFEDPAALRRLQELLHPRVYVRIAEETARLRRRGPVVVEVPLLFETAGEEGFDQVWVVACSPGIQQKRASLRGWDQREFSRRNKAQMPLSQKMGAADLVIWNELSMEWLKPQIDRALRTLACLNQQLGGC